MRHSFEHSYFEHQIADKITATAVAMLSASAAHYGSNVEYVRGVMDTTRANCESFGIDWQPVRDKLRDVMVEGERTVEG